MPATTSRKRLLVRRRIGPEMLTFTATTTVDGQTVDLRRLYTPSSSIPVLVRWGDGNTTLSGGSGSTGQPSHTYALAGTYTITVTKPWLITYLDLRDTRLDIDMNAEAGKLTDLVRGIRLECDATWTIGDDAPLSQHISEIVRFGTARPVVTWHVGSSAGAAMPASFTDELRIDAANVTITWTPETGPGTEIPRTCASLRIRANWSTAQVDAFIDALYDVWAAAELTLPTAVDLAGNNAAPSGTFQDVCPPTTPQEKRFQMLNDTCGLGVPVLSAFVVSS